MLDVSKLDVVFAPRLRLTPASSKEGLSMQVIITGIWLWEHSWVLPTA